MRVGIVGTGSIASKHALAYKNIGFQIVACTNASAEKGKKFAETHAAEYVDTLEKLCAHPQLDYVDVCTLPNFRLPVVELCARNKKHVLVEKPMAVDLATAARMQYLAEEAGIQLGVISQHRFDDATIFLKSAIAAGRLGRILEADAYVKWWRSTEYYARPIKGSWTGEGGGALINQGIHSADLLLYLVGAVVEVAAYWQIASVHGIESEDSVSALLKYANGATGVLQAATAFWPGSPERLEIHGTKGTAIITGDQLTTWDVQDDSGDAPLLATTAASGASDPLAISTLPVERQMLDFAEACRTGRPPRCSGKDGYRALELVRAIYDACSAEHSVKIVSGS